MVKGQCRSCMGTGKDTCKESGVEIGDCRECEGVGLKPHTYYALVLTHKNIGEHVWMHPTVFDYLAEAQRFKHREFIVIKIVEVKV